MDLGQVEIPRTFNNAHLRAIHRHLFQDVYDWAGQHRTVNMSKDGSAFAGVDLIEGCMDWASIYANHTRWHELDHQGFAIAVSHIFMWANTAHPFREGNGRATKVFMQHVAELGGYELDFDPTSTGVSPEAWNTSAALSMSIIERPELDPVPMVRIFEKLSHKREAQPTPETASPLDQLKATPCGVPPSSTRTTIRNAHPAVPRTLPVYPV
ncbi:Fic family protein [Yimella sp. cx-573]|nr:Fic family protein [Yimella sp. cx-573]